MIVHIPIGEPALDFTLTLQGVEYWVCIDERQYSHGRPYFVYTIYRDGACLSEPDWRYITVQTAAGDAAKEIVEQWESQRAASEGD